jgi:hypothetical protein
MAGVQKSKLKLLYIVDILRKKTDENHYLAATEICDELSQLDIPAERKSIYNDIDILAPLPATVPAPVQPVAIA